MTIRCVSLILLLLCCAVPLASATGMAKIYPSPDQASWKTGQEVQVKVMFDNNLNPVARDISLYLDWNPEMLKYVGTDFKVGHTTVAGLLSSHELNLMLGDYTNGYPKGEYALAVVTYKVIGPGDTPILIKVARLNGMDGKPVAFTVGKGAYSITGDAIANPGTIATVSKPTTLPAGGAVVVTPATTYTLIPGVVTSATTLPSALPVQTYQTVKGGSAPGWPALTIGATIPTPYPTTIETTVPTVIVTTTVPTTVPTTARTTWPTATPKEITTVETTATAATPTSSQNIGYSYGIAINDTPTVNETPTINVTANRTLPSPLANSTNLTAVDTIGTWPMNTTMNTTLTTFPTFTIRTTGTKSVINNTSASTAPAGSLVGDAGLVVLAAIAGIALVTVGVVVIRRNRDDDL